MLKDIRIKKGLTQEDISRATGLSVKTISNLELGKKIRPKTKRIIADFLKVKIEEL